jgi:hypothetical protein
VWSALGSAACDQNVAEINAAIERWYTDKGHWPADDLSDIGQDPRYFPEGIPRCPVTREPYSIDPRTHRVLRHRHQRDRARVGS